MGDAISISISERKFPIFFDANFALKSLNMSAMKYFSCQKEVLVGCIRYCSDVLFIGNQNGIILFSCSDKRIKKSNKDLLMNSVHKESRKPNRYKFEAQSKKMYGLNSSKRFRYR